MTQPLTLTDEQRAELAGLVDNAIKVSESPWARTAALIADAVASNRGEKPTAERDLSRRVRRLKALQKALR